MGYARKCIFENYTLREEPQMRALIRKLMFAHDLWSRATERVCVSRDFGNAFVCVGLGPTLPGGQLESVTIGLRLLPIAASNMYFWNYYANVGRIRVQCEHILFIRTKITLCICSDLQWLHSSQLIVCICVRPHESDLIVLSSICICETVDTKRA